MEEEEVKNLEELALKFEDFKNELTWNLPIRDENMGNGTFCYVMTRLVIEVATCVLRGGGSAKIALFTAKEEVEA
jgi:hypothetical protein